MGLQIVETAIAPFILPDTWRGANQFRYHTNRAGSAGSWALGPLGHPDCSIRTSLVFSTIAQTSAAPAYRFRGDRLAGKILVGIVATRFPDGDIALLRRIHQ